MNISLERDALLKPLQTVVGVIERKQVMPILANVLLSVKESNQHILSITGTDSEIEITGQMPLNAEIIENNVGDITLPGRKFWDICRTLPEGATITLSYNDSKCTVRSGKSRFTLSTLPANEFPTTAIQTDGASFSIMQNQLKKLLTKTAFSMAIQDVRYFLNGLLLEILPDEIRATATDGHRLSSNSLKINNILENPLRLIIPRKAITELFRLLEDDEESVTIHCHDQYIQVIAPTFNFTSKLIEGRYPNYDRVIPKNNSKVLSFNVESLKQALNRAAILCNEKFRGVRLDLAENSLKILANNPQQEHAEEEIILEYAEEPIEIACNVSYLLDVLNNIDGKTVKLHIGNVDNGILITESEPNTTSIDSIYVVMPMRL